MCQRDLGASCERLLECNLRCVIIFIVVKGRGVRDQLRAVGKTGGVYNEISCVESNGVGVLYNIQTIQC